MMGAEVEQSARAIGRGRALGGGYCGGWGRHDASRSEGEAEQIRTISPHRAHRQKAVHLYTIDHHPPEGAV